MNPLRILLAEDEESFRSALSQFLTERGCIVEAVETGGEAVAALGTQGFDLIILDHAMPGMSGLNVLQWMLEQKCETPAIVLTGAGSEHVAAEAMKLGAYDYVVKDQIDLYHMPIIINSVRERYLFRKEREGKDKILLTLKDIGGSIKPFGKAIDSLSHVANNSLALLSVNLEEYVQSYALPGLTQEKQSHAQSALEEIREDLQAVTSAVKSMLNLTAAMQRILSDEKGSALTDGAVQHETDSVMEEHKIRMER